MPFTPRPSIENSPIYNDLPADRDEHGEELVSVYKQRYKKSEEVIGVGGERIVLDDGEEAVALRYKGDRYSAITTFYTQRILHTLYPDNFPPFKAVYYEEEKGINVEFREKVIYEEDYEQNEPDIKYLDDISPELRDIGIKIQGEIGSFGGELLFPEYNNSGLVTKDTGEKYEVFLDAISHYQIFLNQWDFVKLYEQMSERGYQNSQIAIVMKAVLRISVNAQEKVTRLNSGKDSDMPETEPSSNILSEEQVEYINEALLSLKE